MTISKLILFIDDDVDDRELFCQTALEVDSSIDCFCAKDGISAIDKLDNEKDFTPDFIFIDLNMPKMDGIECLAKIREFPRLNNAKIFMYSTAFNPRIEEQALQMGATGVLVKPSTLNELSDFLRKTIL